MKLQSYEALNYDVENLEMYYTFNKNIMLVSQIVDGRELEMDGVKDHGSSRHGLGLFCSTRTY